MKAFVAMFAAVASAAAEPWLGYAGYGYAGVPLVYGKSAPCVNAANQPVPCAAGYLHYGKRDAEADPALVYGAYGAYGYGLPYVFGKSAPCVNAANVPVPCAHMGKREAEADPALVYGLPAVGAYGAYGTYGLPVYVPTVKTVSEPCKNEAGEAVPCAKGDPDAKLKYHVISKRESEADPTLYFVNPYGARYGHPHNGFGQELIHSSNFGICTNYLGQRVPGLGC